MPFLYILLLCIILKISSTSPFNWIYFSVRCLVWFRSRFSYCNNFLNQSRVVMLRHTIIRWNCAIGPRRMFRPWAHARPRVSVARVRFASSTRLLPLVKDCIVGARPRPFEYSTTDSLCSSFTPTRYSCVDLRQQYTSWKLNPKTL